MENLTENKKDDVNVSPIAFDDAMNEMTDIKEVLTFVEKTAKHIGYGNPGPFVEMVDTIIPNQIEALERAMNKLQGIY